MEWTQEKMHSLQQLHITLHGALDAPQCAINTTFPYKPVLVIRAGSNTAAASASASSATAASIEIPLSARVDLSSPRTSLALSPDATVISLGMTADLEPAPNEEAFPSARELDAREYAACYCRHCGTAIFSARSPASPFTVHSLPSSYWSELTDLWFCHTTDNAHMAALASLQIRVEAGKIMLDKMGIRVHWNDLAHGQAWKDSESVARLTREATAAAAAAAGGTAGSSAAAAASSSSPSAPAAAPSTVAPREIWSPLPCVGCRAVLGSILLTLRPSSDPAAAVQVAASGEVRLLKYQLSNCFRKKPAAAATTAQTAGSATGAAAASGSMEDVAESQTHSGSSSASASSAPSSSAASSSCLCSSYSLPAAGSSAMGALRLTCSNLWKSYTFESLVSEDLLARFQKSPANRFVVESIDEEAEAHMEAAAAQAATSGAAAATATGSVTSGPKLFLRLLVTHWNLSLSSTLSAAFPLTPTARSSNRMVPVLKLEFSAHASEDDAALAKWIAPPKAGVAAQAIEKIHYALSDCRALLDLLHARSGCWPASMRGGTLDPTMRKSCLVKLHALPDK